jgi:hypothetical protein
MLLIETSTGAGALCSATMIDLHTLVTAAHCVDPVVLGASSITIVASNAPTLAEVVDGVNLYDVVETRRHPDWHYPSLANDIAVVRLAVAPPVTPKPWNFASLAAAGGRAVRSLGYGTTGAANQGDGTKREVALTVERVTPSLLYIGNQVDKGICHGDSGGPTFMTFDDGVERLVGVHSFTQDTTTAVCVWGADTRVDAFQDFVVQWLSEKEAPTCADDGRCVPGCASPDVDCVCQADGVCSTACPELARDPDCPKNCAADGLCATGTCPVPDPDCRLFGEACTTPSQCQHRSCVLDAQHAAPYCSQPCTGTGACPTGYECASQGHCQHVQLPVAAVGAACTKGRTWCGAVGVCTGAAASSTVCALPCVEASGCQAGQLCEAGFDAVKRCVVPPPVVVPLARVEEVAATGCGAAPGGVTVLMGLALLRRRRRRTWR